MSKTDEGLNAEIHAHSEKGIGLFKESAKIHRSFNSDSDERSSLEEIQQTAAKDRAAIAELREVTELQKEDLKRQRERMAETLKGLPAPDPVAGLNER